MKTKRIFSAFLLLCSAMLLLAGCYEDKGNYTYKVVKEVVIELPRTSQTVLVGEPFSLSPTITSSIPDSESDYTYRWLSVPSSNVYEEVSVLLASKDIVEWVPTTILKPGGYILVLEATDKNTAISYYSPRFTLTFQNPMGKGIALLTEQDNVGQVELLAYFNNDFTHYEAEGLPTLTNPSRIVHYADRFSPYLGNTLATAEQSALIAIGESGAYRLDPTNLTYDDRMDLLNAVIGDIPAGFKAANVFPNTSKREGYATLLDGNMYQYSYGGSVTILWTIGLHYNRTIDNVTFPVAPWSVSFNSRMVLYNTDDQSFYVANDKSNVSNRLSELEPEGTSNFTDTGRDLIWMQGRSVENTDYDKVYAMMKESEQEGYDPDKRYLVAFASTGATYIEYDVTEAEAIREGQNFCMTRSNKAGTLSILYYRTDKKIYAYDFNAKTTTAVYETTGSRVLTDISITIGGDFSNNMLVCTWDPSAAASGQVEIFDFDEVTGTLIAAEYGEEGAKEPIRFGGFDRIVSADWKTR